MPSRVRDTDWTWKTKALEEMNARLCAVKTELETHRRNMVDLELEYTELFESMKALGRKPTVVESVKRRAIAEREPGIRYDLNGTGVMLVHETIDRLLDLKGDIRAGDIAQIIALEPHRSKTDCALNQASRGYVGYLIANGYWERVHRGKYRRVEKALPKMRSDIDESSSPLRVVGGVVTLEEPAARGYGT